MEPNPNDYYWVAKLYAWMELQRLIEDGCNFTRQKVEYDKQGGATITYKSFLPSNTSMHHEIEFEFQLFTELGWYHNELAYKHIFRVWKKHFGVDVPQRSDKSIVKHIDGTFHVDDELFYNAITHDLLSFGDMRKVPFSHIRTCNTFVPGSLEHSIRAYNYIRPHFQMMDSCHGYASRSIPAIRDSIEKKQKETDIYNGNTNDIKRSFSNIIKFFRGKIAENEYERERLKAHDDEITAEQTSIRTSIALLNRNIDILYVQLSLMPSDLELVVKLNCV